jgi:hypothetical protein
VHRRLLTIPAAIAAAALIAVGVDGIAHATTGSSLILGHINYADGQTTIRSTNGAPLGLRPARPTDPPLVVAGTGKVRGFNADRIDDLDSSQLQRRVASTCPVGQAMVGASSTGQPLCRSVEPTTLIARAAAPGLVDEPQRFIAGDVPAGRYRVELSATAVPTVRGTSEAPKRAECHVGASGRTLLSTRGHDVGTDPAYLTGNAIAEVPATTDVSIVCGFPRGTWSFVSGGAPVLALTPMPDATSLPIAWSGDAALNDR